MDLTLNHLNDIKLKIAETVVSALEQGTVTSEEIDGMSSFALEEIEKVKTHEDLIAFLRELSAKSPVFSYILVTESGEIKQKEDNVVAHKAEDLLKTGQVDAALEMVKEATR